MVWLAHLESSMFHAMVQAVGLLPAQSGELAFARLNVTLAFKKGLVL